MKRRFLCYGIFVLLTVAAVAPAADIMAARLWATAESTRLVLESDARLNYSISGLESPPRLVIDVRSSSAAARLNNADVAAAGAYIRSLRVSRRDDNLLRLVFDLTGGIDYRVSRLPPIAQYRHRLILDIQPKQPPDPLLALIEELGESYAPFVVLIDPGHGGEDPGAVSPNNNYEKNIVLKISRLLAEEINRRDGMRALLTRDDDRFIPLFERVRIAHRLNADVFVSVHADSVKSRKARGSSVFVLSQKGASSRFARRLAENANLSDLVGGAPQAATDPVLDSALRQFSRDGKDRASRLLAESALKHVSQVNDLHSERVESAGFAVLKSPSIPSILLETAFISNPNEEEKLLDAAFQKRLVGVLADALQQYKDTYHVRR